MNLPVAPVESLIDILDRVHDKSIVIEAWARSGRRVCQPLVDGTAVGSFVVASAEVYEGHGKEGQKKDVLGHLFPYWRKDLWSR